MYNKCDKCGVLLDNYQDRRLILDSQGKVSTRCMDCYEDHIRINAKV